MSSQGSFDSGKKGKGKSKSNEEILLGFQKLRSEQRFLSTKLSELELELHEHRIVLETLQELQGDRKCFRMIGGVLCERTVKEVVPVLKTNEENLVKVIESLNNQLIAKGHEINKYKDDHNVKFRHVDELNIPTDETKSTASETNSAVGSAGAAASASVPVP